MSVTNLAAFPRGCSSDPGRRPSAWAHRRAVLPLLEGSTSLSVCINPTCASSRSSSSVSICLIPLEQTRVTRPISPQTVAFPIKQTLAFRWKSFSLRKVCLVTVNSWKCGSNHAGPCREMVSMGAINTRQRPGECRMLGSSLQSNS